MREQEVRNLWEAYLEVCENQQLDEVSDAKVAAVRKARQKNVNKAFDKLDDSRGSSQNLATAISKLQKNQKLSAKRDTRNEEVEELDEVSGELVDRSVNKRIAATGAAYDAEMRDRTPENMRASVRAGKKEASMKTAAAKRRKRINKEEVETWVNSLIEEGYDLSDYTWEEMYDAYANLNEGNRGENETGMSNVSKLKRRQKKFAAGIVHPDEAGELEGERQKAHKSGRYVPTRGSGVREGYDTFDAILEHLIAEGYADTNESALAIMANMSEEWRQSIVEGGFNSSGRYDVGGGRTVGPVAGAVRSLFSGNLPKGQTYVPPSPQKGTNRPSAVPSSKGDSGKLTDFGAGGGKAKLKTGMSVGQVERQGRRNKGDYSG